MLVISVSSFTVVFLYDIFGAYFLSLSSELKINSWILLCGLLYYFVWFFSFLHLSHFGLLGVLLHSLVMVSFSFFKLLFPLHPFILLYPHASTFLPATESTFLNLFLLFFLVGVVFVRINLPSKLAFFLFSIIFSTLTTPADSKVEKKKLKIAVVQVGLYFKKGGTTKNFFPDLLDFLDRHPGINTIAFSENNFFSYKSEYNTNMAEQLLSDINKKKLSNKYHIFLSFSGYKDFNNIITLYQFLETNKINQKMTLIPFIEKPGIFNTTTSPDTEFYSVRENYKKSIFNIMGSSVSTYICYDALFPEAGHKAGDIVLIQSNYSLLNNGHGFERLKRIATYLAKFVNGMQSDIVINIQNTGGTVVLFDGWRVDHEIYEKSKNEVFFVIDTSKL